MCGDIYRYLGEEMKFLWDGDLKLNTVHTRDVARALVELGKWRSNCNPPQSTLNDIISYANDEKLEQFKLPSRKAVGKAPLFNLVDDSNATQSSVAEVIANVFRVKTGFLGGLVSTFARMDIEEMIDDVNEKHIQAWSEMLHRSNIRDSPLTPYLDEHFFKKNPIALDPSKIKKTLNFKCKHSKLTTSDIQAIVDGFRFVPSFVPSMQCVRDANEVAQTNSVLRFIKTKWIVGFVVLIIIFDYFSVTVAVGVGLVTKNRAGGFGLGVTILVVFNVLFLIFCASYAAILFIHPGYITNSFIPAYHPGRAAQNKDKDTDRTGTSNHSNQSDCTTYPPTFRVQATQFDATYCSQCQLWRPPRAHHDRHANRCVWEFDHYCPWIGQSVGGHNHKHFVTFLFWCVVVLSFTAIALGVSYPSLISDEHGDGLWSGRGRGPIIGAIAVSSFFAFFVGGLLFNHIWLACDSLTTFEDMFEVRTIRARDASILSKHYDPWQLQAKKACKDHWYYVWGNPRTEGNLWWLESPYRNWCFRMGANPLAWFVPFAKPHHDLLNVEYNPRFDQWGRARMRSEWPEYLR
ncbi:hypothetical protein E3P81_03876 [Wallemia ichthyophaga]|nr:hypothetical protein E3P97_03877 [Wallemia ichthyophaga]TIB28109.1 hypothetical protein E3P85_03842 [Wallemia ichthyophaga]TIB43679.1 hypothetical protein E3P82_03882 [Wallemia ichthyophaga]TIB45904.1 hypothetical protein E3P81_03876 [Wallemia ichthyophaga]TIB48133.1 hypothetical protein E3P80_03886 [Wallemia ichthyophaga]